MLSEIVRDEKVTQLVVGMDNFEKFEVRGFDTNDTPVLIKTYIAYLDENNDPIAKVHATKVKIMETDQNGEEKTTYGTCVPPEPLEKPEKSVLQPKESNITI